MRVEPINRYRRGGKGGFEQSTECGGFGSKSCSPTCKFVGLLRWRDTTGHILVAAIDLEEDGPLSVAGLGGLPGLDDLDLIRVIDKDAHGSTNGGQLVGERREICDLVGRHRQPVKDLNYVRKNTRPSSIIRNRME